MKFTGSFTTASINVNSYKRLLKTYLENRIKEIANVWLAGVTGRVPIWSGMSQGSLLELSELINGGLVIIPKAGVRSRIELGRRYGEATIHTEISDFNITIVTDVSHYNVQEFTNVGVSKSAPWRSLEAGKELARDEMSKTRLPKPILKTKKVLIHG